MTQLPFCDSKSSVRRYVHVCHLYGMRGPRDFNSDITAVSSQSKMSCQGALTQKMCTGTDFLCLELMRGTANQGLYIKTSNSNHRLKSVVNICVLKKGDLRGRVSSRENEARFLHQNGINLRDRETKWPPISIFFPRMHLHRHPNANTQLDLGSPIVGRDKLYLA